MSAEHRPPIGDSEYHMLVWEELTLARFRSVFLCHYGVDPFDPEDREEVDRILDANPLLAVRHLEYEIKKAETDRLNDPILTHPKYNSLKSLTLCLDEYIQAFTEVFGFHPFEEHTASQWQRVKEYEITFHLELYQTEYEERQKLVRILQDGSLLPDVISPHGENVTVHFWYDPHGRPTLCHIQDFEQIVAFEVLQS